VVIVGMEVGVELGVTAAVAVGDGENAWEVFAGEELAQPERTSNKTSNKKILGLRSVISCFMFEGLPILLYFYIITIITYISAIKEE